MVAPTKPLGCCLLAAATLLLLGTLARCQDETRSNWTPFRPTDGTCHEIGFVVSTLSPEDWTDAQLADDGTKLCSTKLLNWQYARTERSGNNNRWKHYCRRCGLPQDSVLMWFGNAPACYGSCPAGWLQITPGVYPGMWGPDAVLSPFFNHLLVDGEFTGSDNSPQFGEPCSKSSTGKVLCALGGRPASVQCSYTWRGTAPDCRDACEPGETLVAKDWYGDGKRCLRGTYNKMFGTAPLCAGECNVGDRVMARAQSKEDVPADQDPGGLGKPCSKSSGWKVR
ncbi:hypothetical protein COHA_000311 [Chlorella ohadii]|uniref:Uncharacterized protein n=1 Tax=Chlorella ohadii TaxID=2649997 RepID=A0AAD5H969_9CHLO|nr:hypothetical protein COHA_000311 [Chlorella ohadii]